MTAISTRGFILGVAAPLTLAVGAASAALTAAAYALAEA
jgi:hypothetical protein